MPELAAPLAGIRVLDLSEGTAGGFATKLLAVFGADVLKVERPGTGDPLRAQGPFPGDVPDPEQGGQFLYLNMNKRSVTLSLGHQAGRRAARELYGWADLVVESFRARAARRVGARCRGAGRAEPPRQPRLDRALRTERALPRLPRQRDHRAGAGRDHVRDGGARPRTPAHRRRAGGLLRRGLGLQRRPGRHHLA